MKEKTKNEYLRRTRKPLETKLLIRTYQRDKYCRKIFGTILKVNERSTLKNGPENKNAIITMYKVQYPGNIDRLYVSRSSI